jgi:DnaJ-class molecular chaperone
MLVKTYHPDSHPDGGVSHSETDNRIMVMINAAYGELERRITKWQEN